MIALMYKAEENGLAVEVWHRADGSYPVMLRDVESREIVGVQVFEDEDDARAYANLCLGGYE